MGSFIYHSSNHLIFFRAFVFNWSNAIASSLSTNMSESFPINSAMAMWLDVRVSHERRRHFSAMTFNKVSHSQPQQLPEVKFHKSFDSTRAIESDSIRTTPCHNIKFIFQRSRLTNKTVKLTHTHIRISSSPCTRRTEEST